MNFSQRIGLEPATRPFQTNSMDQPLRVGLWNAFELTFLPLMLEQARFGDWNSRDEPTASILKPLWILFFKWPLGTLSPHAASAMEQVRTWYFYQKVAPWNKVYEFAEFLGNLNGNNVKGTAKLFRDLCNRFMEREFSGFRFVGKTISPITNEVEIEAIVRAASTDNALLAPVGTHIDTALKLFSDRAAPDYRNSMKESISAVEAICKIIAENDKTTLGPALDAVKTRVNLHPKLQEGFKALYGYTSDTHGIRHALKDDAEPEAEDAKFFLVACSGFVNYLTEKARKHDLLA